MRIAGVQVSLMWVAQLARMVKEAGAVELADRIDRANRETKVAVLALTVEERAIILAALEDPPDWYAEQCAVVGDGLDDLRAVLRGEPARPTWHVTARWNDGKVRTMKLNVHNWNDAMRIASAEIGTEPPHWSGGRYIVSVSVRRENN